MQYYDFSAKKRSWRTRFAYCYYFTYGTNEDSDEAQDSLPDDFKMLAWLPNRKQYKSSHTRDKLST
jgi:type I restriction enzyme R subunit